MSKGLKKWLITAAVLAMVLGSCGDKGPVSSSGGASNTSGEENISAAQEADTENARWTELWPGQPMQINLNAKSDVIGSFVSDGNYMYLAAKYDDLEKGEKLYCYHFSTYYRKDGSFHEDMEYPNDLALIPEDIRTHDSAFWDYYLDYSNAAALYKIDGVIELEILKREVVTLNGSDFLREEALASSTDEWGTNSTQFVAYYYQTENGQGVCVFGDCSEEQDKFEKIKDVAEAIMSTYREKG